MNQLIIALCICLACFSCKKDNQTPSEPYDTFIFGTTYGFCFDHCTKLFSISNGQLFPGETNLASEPFKFKTTPLSNDKYSIAKQLIDSFPSYLKSNPNKTFGCPDCVDQGAIHIKITKNGIKQYWRIDPDVNTQPSEIRPYIQQLITTLRQL